MLDARFSHLYFCESLPTLQRGLSAIADGLVVNTFCSSDSASLVVCHLYNKDFYMIYSVR